VATYSFIDNLVAISGPNGAFNLGGPGVANADGGITIVMTEDKNTMTIGAGGEAMHSLHSGKSATLTCRFLKTSPQNQLLSEMYAADTAGAASHGRNTISIRDLARGDTITAQEVAFAKFADITYAKDGGEMVWAFHCAKVDFVLGSGLSL
jgi:Bacteriophage KPP10, Structural protein ORF10